MEKQYIMHVVRMVDQFCQLNHFTWNLHGPLLRMMMSGGERHNLIMDHPLEFVVFSKYDSYPIKSPVETLASNLRVCGYQIEIKGPYFSKLTTKFKVMDQEHNVSIILTNTYPPIYFTSDSIVLDANGITTRKVTAMFDVINTSRGVALLDRILDLQNNEVKIETVALPGNVYKSHKEHNKEYLHNIDTVISQGYRVVGGNVHLYTMNGECPVCMEDKKCATMLTCGHEFCLSCLCGILNTQEHPRCSMCRSELTFATS
jgi:Zinc finger, C3HC4 type (RING finger)